MSIVVYYLKTVLPAVQKAARECGYAVGLHGSMTRDLDLIAVPWAEDAKPVEELVEAVREAVGGTIIPDGTPGGRYDKAAGKFVAATVRSPEHKPHGRLAWSIQLGGSAYVDLSVMPRVAKQEPMAVCPECHDHESAGCQTCHGTGVITVQEYMAQR